VITPLPSLSQVSAFLVRRKWTEKSGKKRLNFKTGEAFESQAEVAYQVFEKNSEQTKEPVRIVLPIKTDGEIPRRYLEDALGMLASYYQTSAEQIASAMRSLNVDILSGIHPRNSVSLSRAQEIVTTLKNFITQGANAEIDPTPFVSNAKGNRIVEDVEFGHTFAGSFGFRIECPLSSEDRQMNLIGEMPRPFERRVLERLAIGFLTVEQADAIDDIAPVCDNYRAGFTANICDALIDLCEPAENESFGFQFEWSTLVPLIKPLEGMPLSFKVTPKKYALLQRASDALKQMVVESKTKMTGAVVGLSSDVPPLQKGLMAHRKVTLLIAGGAFEKLRMQLEVSDQDYQLALDAHAKGRLVIVEGTPIQRGTHWRIEEHAGLSAL